MNNRTQQKFDRSIREAVAATKAFSEREDAERLAKKQQHARDLLPAIEERLWTGRNARGPLSPEALLECRRLRSDLRRVLGLSLDRKGAEIGTHYDGCEAVHEICAETALRRAEEPPQ